MASNIRLVIADVDGTLVTKSKVLTPRSIAAVKRLRDSGIAFTITSGRPPLGMRMLIGPLALSEAIAAFNGGMFVHPDLSVIAQSFVPADTASRIIETIVRRGLDAWVYTDQDWLVRSTDAPHVAHEEWTVKFAPKVVSEFGRLDRVAKIVGVSDDYATVAACETAVLHECGNNASATRSQPYYLDVTHPDANKGHVVTALSEALSIPPAQIATIGDGPNDVLMFEKSGLSIAMGNASAEVQQQARFVTSSNEEEGFSKAIDAFIFGDVGDRSAIPDNPLHSAH
ncbi:MAG: HAD family hydrolase [Acidobacteriota bacterium]|nr:HAD family hydrolase [Acidobacteriota bacterium]